jgi:hypothetical protein
MANYTAGTEEVTAITQYISSMFGAPVVNVELDTTNYITAFNTSIEEYSNFITQWAIKANIANALGLDGATDFTQRWVAQNYEFAKSFARAYSEQVNAGGETPMYKDSFLLAGNKQDYYLPDDIIINEILWQEPPAITRYLVDPNNNPAWVNFEFGWGYMGHSYMYVVPAYFSIQLAQATEMRWKLWRGDYTYKISPAGEDGSRVAGDYTGRTRNKVTIFPCPKENQGGIRVWYFYRKKEDLAQYCGQTAGQYVNNPGTMRMDEIPYSAFNSSSKFWVKRYSYAIAKEMLGNIRGKFDSLPIPDAEVKMDGDTLRDEGISLQDKLKDTLKEELDAMDVAKMLEEGANKAESINKTLGYNPMGIYMG